MNELKVICINDSNRPKEIPPQAWCKKGEEYTIIDAARLPLQGNKIGLKFAELSLEEYFPYEWFLADRFRPVDDVLAEQAVEELIEEALGRELIEID